MEDLILNKCYLCNTVLSTPSNHRRHFTTMKHKKLVIKREKEIDNELNKKKPKFKCEFCDKILASKDSLRRHYITCKYKKILDGNL
jgi:hypothetical protein